MTNSNQRRFARAQESPYGRQETGNEAGEEEKTSGETDRASEDRNGHAISQRPNPELIASPEFSLI
jgi:hypothetical protein